MANRLRQPVSCEGANWYRGARGASSTALGVGISKAAAAAACVVALAAFVGGCSSASCSKGTLSLRLGLIDDAQLADTITVTGDDPGATVSDTFAHTPNTKDPTENFYVAVSWPAGYPTNALVHLQLRAFAAGVLIGYNTADVRLSPGCTAGSALLGSDGILADVDGGDSD